MKEIAFTLFLTLFLLIFTEGVVQAITPLTVERSSCVIPASVTLANPAFSC